MIEAVTCAKPTCLKILLENGFYVSETALVRVGQPS